MLRHLHIRNLALIEELSLDFSPGMTVLTGETGAGKSIVLDAMALLAGSRSTPSLVRSGADRAAAEAVFEVEAGGRVALLLTNLGLEPEVAGEVLLRREVLASGRSRASINGRLVPVSQLAEVASLLLEIGGQHEQQALLEAATQRDFFDEFAKLLPLRGKVSTAYHRVQEAHAALDGLAREDRERAQRRDFLQFQVEELENLGLTVCEQAELEADRSRLSHLEEIGQQGELATILLTEGSQEEGCALDLLGKAVSSVETMAEHDPAVRPILEALIDIQSRLGDAGYDLKRYVSGLEADPGRLEEVSDRLDAIKKALRKHGPTEEDAIRNLGSMREELDGLENYEERREQARAALKAATAELDRLARDLSNGRERARNAFVRPLEALLKDFAMPGVRLDVVFRPATGGVPLAGDRFCGPTGAEEVEFLFCANAGETMQPLRRVASGGELSRIMLALRTLSAERGEVPLLIFDEVDAGISGVAARRVAERLGALGERHQILCVTHSPSVAAAAQNHFLVEKHHRDGRTVTEVLPLEAQDRLEELARLLDGGQISGSGLALAAELLKAAG